MTENRDPVSCPACGTVNPWMNENCRDCGESLEDATPVSQPEPVAAEKKDEDHREREEGRVEPKYSWQPWTWFRSSNPSGKEDGSRRRLNARWILLGLFGYFVIFALGHVMIEKQMIENDHQRQTIYEKMSTMGELSDEKKQEYLQIFMPVIVAVGVLLLIIPVVMGGVVGFFSSGVREGAISMGAAALLVFLFQGGQSMEMAAPILFAAGINAGLGAVGALGGRLVRQRIRGER